MTKKYLLISVILFGLVVMVIGVFGQAIEPVQPTTPTTPNVPVAAADLVPLISPVITDLTIPETNLSQGRRGRDVRKIQEILRKLGYLPADFETTENFGPRTRRALINFQREQGLPAVGFFGPATRAALRNRLQERRPVIDRNVDLACMRTAVEKREGAILSAYEAYVSKIRATYQTRKAELLTAWNIQDPKERHDAVKSAWDKARNSMKDAKRELNQSNREIWNQFRQDAKNCRAIAVETQDLEKIEVPEE